MRLEHFLMVDRLTALDVAGGTVRAESTVPEHSPVFEGHFPGYPILPGVLMVETMAQTAGWLAMAANRFQRMVFLAQVAKAKMRAVVPPGAALMVAGTLVHEGSGYAVATATIHHGAALAAEAELRYSVAAFPNEDIRRAMLATARRVGVPETLLPADG